MTSKSAVGAAIAPAREPDCDYPGCDREAAFPFWVPVPGQAWRVVALVCRLHSQAPSRRLAAAERLRRLQPGGNRAAERAIAAMQRGRGPGRSRASEQTGGSK